ncbi:MAG: hypothetical protein II185_00465 [Firmicutes bacterium]|nr:hypothetical protein [Bacillota bacterium]MBQ3930950.1 hypothetical protein [Bacillota bacterium]
MKRRIAFVLALIMVLCVVLSACGSTTPKPAVKEPITKEALLGGYKKKAEQSNGGSYTMAMDAKISVSVMGQSQDMEMTSEMKVESNKEAAHISGTATTKAAGQTENTDMDVYSIKSGDGFDVYTNTDGTWYKSRAVVNVDGNVQAVLSMQDVSSMTMTETENDYIVEGKAALAEVFDALKNYIGGFDEMDDLGFDLGSMDLKNVDPAKVTYHFDKKTQEPTGVDIDMAACMNSLMQQLMKQAAGLGQQVGGDSGLNIDLSAFMKMEAERFNISIKDIVFDKNIKIELPEAAKNAAEVQIIGPANVPAGYEEFEVDEMRLYLPSGFSEQQAQGYTKAFTDGTNVVLVLKEEKSLFGNYASNMEEYIQLVAEANKSRGITEVEYENGRPVFEYEYTSGSNTYKYYSSLYESDEAYWIVQFACMKQTYDKLRPSFVNMADIVSFDE